MAGATKLMTAGGGGVSITPDASIASDITVKVPTSGVSGGTLVCSDSSGNVGIGTSSPNVKLGVVGAIHVFGTGVTPSTSSGFQIAPSNANNDAYLWNFENAKLLFATNNTERMRIDSSGNLLVNTTSRASAERVNITVDGNAQENLILVNTNTSAGSNTAIGFRRAAGTTVGTITTTTSSTAYNTSSDYRLKENIQPMQNALATVAQLNPVTYTWKADGSDGQGFIAHELQTVVPDCVTGEKDAVDDEGNPVYQGIDTSFLVATLTKAIQEQQAQIETLTAKVAALEAK